ncbi:hypothetical protein AB0K74_15855 [Streptomyces sp. NPDC056159]|uniref:hypothetical protein n=1 Tax=unclassified Streptomyces TaxID=2593676 RepID=UPI00342128D5
MVLRLTGLDLGGTPRAGHVRGRITVPPDAVPDAPPQTSEGLPVTGVTADPASGTLTSANMVATVRADDVAFGGTAR